MYDVVTLIDDVVTHVYDVATVIYDVVTLIYDVVTLIDDVVRRWRRCTLSREVQYIPMPNHER
jgi:hypothetical protein